MGDIGGETRVDQYLPLSLVRGRLQKSWTLDETDYRTGGPARYVRGLNPELLVSSVTASDRVPATDLAPVLTSRS